MSSLPKRSVRPFTASLAALVLAGLAGAAQAGIEVGSSSSSYSNLVTVDRNPASGTTLKESRISIDTLEKMQEQLKRTQETLEKLTRQVSDQASTISTLNRQLEEVKRTTGSSDLSNVQRDLDSQKGRIDQLQRSLEDLSRKVK